MMSTIHLSGPVSGDRGSCKHQHIVFVSYKSSERLQMLPALAACSEAPLGRPHGVLSALKR